MSAQLAVILKRLRFSVTWNIGYFRHYCMWQLLLFLGAYFSTPF